MADAPAAATTSACSMRTVFAGTPEFAAHVLSALLGAGHEVALVLCQPDRPAGRGLRLTECPVKRLASARQLLLLQPSTLREAATIERIAAARPDVLVVAAYGLILPQAVLDIARHGAVNVHASLLPRWRGAAPIQRALLAGDDETGVSIMKMDAGLDTGPVYTQRRIAIDAEDDAGSLNDKLASLGAEMLVAALPDIAAGRASWRAQADEGASYASKLTKPETFIDWSRPAAELARKLRAFSPQPGAQSILRGERIKLWRAVAGTQHGGEPGTIIGATADGVLVACGDGALCVTELQRPGGRRLSAEEFLRGVPLRAGERFESVAAAI
jgi:methionyl-tRNA formyltransferase